MSVALQRMAPDPAWAASVDSIVVLGGVSWEAYELLLEGRGDGSIPRLTYLKGLLEIMSPSDDHEWRKKQAEEGR